MPSIPIRQHAAGDNATAQPDADGLGLDGFVAPDDEGLSLDELSQAYAALLARGSDPYAEIAEPQPAPDVKDEGTEPNQDDALRQTRDDADAAFDVTPKCILEAILFVGHPTGEPLISERIAALMRGVRPAEIDDLVRELNDEYAAAGAAYAIESVGPGYKLSLRPQFSQLRDTFHGRIRQARLSQAAIDILAIVGYHQPVAAEEINRLRGKPSEAILSQLVRRDLLTIEPQGEKKAKPKYRTTGRFLDLFGLEDLSELPKSHDIEREL